MSAAYTRKIGKSVLVPRPVRTTYGFTTVLTAVPLSKVLRELTCTICHRHIEVGELVLRERWVDSFRTTCEVCADWLTIEDLF